MPTELQRLRRFRRRVLRALTTLHAGKRLPSGGYGAVCFAAGHQAATNYVIAEIAVPKPTRRTR